MNRRLNRPYEVLRAKHLARKAAQQTTEGNQMPTREQQAAFELAREIKTAGLRVFLAERGTYGFFTDADGKRVVCFQWDGLEGMTFSGNFRSTGPGDGSGWRMERGDFHEMLKAYPPQWAVPRSSWAFTTLAQHQKTYQQSSRYAEVETL